MEKFFPYGACKSDSYKINKEDAKKLQRILTSLRASDVKRVTSTVDQNGYTTYSNGAKILGKFKTCQKIDDADVEFWFRPEKDYWGLSDEHIQIVLKLEKENFDWLRFLFYFTPRREIFKLDITVKEYGKNKQKAVELLPCFMLELTFFKYKKGCVYFNEELKGVVR